MTHCAVPVAKQDWNVPLAVECRGICANMCENITEDNEYEEDTYVVVLSRMMSRSCISH